MSQENLAYDVLSASSKEKNVHKFGGSSLATTECIERVANIIVKHCTENDIIVVSANGKTTDGLIELLHLAEGKESVDLVTQQLDSLVANQQALIESLVFGDEQTKLLSLLLQDKADVLTWLQSAPIEQYTNDVLALGELWSARLMSAVLNKHFTQSQYIDARSFLVVGPAPHCQVQQHSKSAITSKLQTDVISVITGFIARDTAGQSVTLGRNGSDYSATIIADLVDAKTVTLWTDVDGIYSADPRIVPNARKLHRLPNDVAKELGRLGNPVLHANTLKPLDTQNIHLHVRSSYEPDKHASEIGDFGHIAQQELCVTSLDNLLLCESALFIKANSAQLSCWQPLHVNTQEHSILVTQEHQLAIEKWCTENAGEVAFTSVSLVAAVAYNIGERGGLKARFKRAVKTADLVYLSTSLSGHSIFALYREPVSVELLNKIHRKLTKNARNIGLVVAGLGNIGRCFLDMLPKQIHSVAVLENVHLVGLVGSKKAFIDNDGIDLSQALKHYEKDAVTYDKQQLLQWLTHHPYDELVLVDITPSEEFSVLYHDFFSHGVHVIGANKWAASSTTNNVELLQAAAKKSGSYWLGNTTVGAGLPVNYAIDDLRQSGDEIVEIAGIFSGTLSWLFQKYDGTQPFSKLVKQALAEGLTEPDPREDLSGRDVQRKLLILARAAGYQLELADIACENLVPKSLQTLSSAGFLASIEELDAPFQEQLKKAQNQNGCIRYVARFSVQDGQLNAQVSLETLSESDAFANLTPCDNIFQITSAWYQDNPLIIRGPGAGREVTAGGLHSDLVKLCRRLTLATKQAKIKGIN